MSKTEISEDDLEIVDTQEQGPSEEEMAPPSQKAKKAAIEKKVVKAEGYVTFASARREEATFDINVGEEKIHGKWDKDREHLLFRVPADKADAFARHHHVTSGRVVKVK